jgi:hypothetical protein
MAKSYMTIEIWPIILSATKPLKASITSASNKTRIENEGLQ